MDSVKDCTSCKKTKPLKEYPPLQNRADGRGSICRHCLRKKYKEKQKDTTIIAYIL